jgi:GT2 family glycosyltransferase
MGDPARLQGVGSFIDLYGFNYLVGEGEIDNGQYGNAPIPIFHAGTTALVIRRELLRKIGLLDSRFQHGFDDIDFCWRIMLGGYKVVCVPRCSMYHKVAGTTGKVHLDYVVYHREKNRIMTAIKNYSLKNQIRVLPVILAFDLIQIGWFILSRNHLMFLTMIKALTWDVRNFEYIWGQHLIIEYRIRRVPDERILGRMLKLNVTELRRRLIAVSQ